MPRRAGARVRAALGAAAQGAAAALAAGAVRRARARHDHRAELAQGTLPYSL